MAASTTSVYINHRPTYHNRKDAPYVLPNDEPEHIRLEEQARRLSAVMNNQIIHTPITTDKEGLRMLDVGCGTGFVTDYLGQRFAKAQVFGLDLSRVPQIRKHPANVHFLQGNVLSERPRDWLPQNQDEDGLSRTQDAELFDLVFSRLLVAGMPDWPKYIQTSFSLLKAGGFMEVHDLDWIWYGKDGQVISDEWPWWQRLKAAGEAKGLNWSCATLAADWMREAGFQDIQVTEYRWPFGGQWEQTPEWRAFGDYVASNMPSMVHHMIAKTMEDQGASEEDIESMRAEMKRDFAPEEGKHWVMKVTVGKKPSS